VACPSAGLAAACGEDGEAAPLGGVNQPAEPLKLLLGLCGGDAIIMSGSTGLGRAAGAKAGMGKPGGGP